jgi:hypothetical protein
MLRVSWYGRLVVPAALAFAATPVAASDSVTHVTMRAEVSARTSLQVSTKELRFEIPAGTTSAEASLDFTASARTRSGAEVVLTIVPDGAVSGPGGAADIEVSLDFVGHGPGLASGHLDSAASSVAGRWSGSGSRRGRLTFRLRSASPGTYIVPLTAILSAP